MAVNNSGEQQVTSTKLSSTSVDKSLTAPIARSQLADVSPQAARSTSDHRVKRSGCVSEPKTMTALRAVFFLEQCGRLASQLPESFTSYLPALSLGLPTGTRCALVSFHLFCAYLHSHPVTYSKINLVSLPGQSFVIRDF